MPAPAKERATLSLGPMATPLQGQIAGFAELLPPDPDKLGHLQLDLDAVNRLYVRRVLPDSRAKAARQRIGKRVFELLSVTQDRGPMRCPNFGTPAYNGCDCQVCDPGFKVSGRRNKWIPTGGSMTDFEPAGPARPGEYEADLPDVNPGVEDVVAPPAEPAGLPECKACGHRGEPGGIFAGERTCDYCGEPMDREPREPEPIARPLHRRGSAYRVLRALFARYMAYVRDVEGADFVTHSRRVGGGDPFSPSEWAALEGIAEMYPDVTPDEAAQALGGARATYPPVDLEAEYHAAAQTAADYRRSIEADLQYALMTERAHLVRADAFANQVEGFEVAARAFRRLKLGVCEEARMLRGELEDARRCAQVQHAAANKARAILADLPPAEPGFTGRLPGGGS